MAETVIANDIGFALYQALIGIWNSFVQVVPALIGAIVLLIIGWIIGKVLKHVVIKLLDALKIDEWAKKEHLSGALGHKKISHLFGSLTKWYVIILFLAQATQLINMDILKSFLLYAVQYLSLLIGIVIVIILGLLLGRYFKNRIQATKHPYSNLVGWLVEVVVVYFAIVIALEAAGFPVTILLDAFRIAFAAAAFTVAIIVGISVGLAFREDARSMIQEAKKGWKGAVKKKR
ncbi:MAG: hypothetical protein ABH821_00690 [archaeon]